MIIIYILYYYEIFIKRGNRVAAMYIYFELLLLLLLCWGLKSIPCRQVQALLLTHKPA